MDAYNSLTVPHLAYKTGSTRLHMVQSSYSVVAISINSLPQSIAPPRYSINESEYSYWYMFRVKIFWGSYVSTKYFASNFLNEIFSVENF